MATRELARFDGDKVVVEHINQSGDKRRDVVTLKRLTQYQTAGGKPRLRLTASGAGGQTNILVHRIRAIETSAGERHENVNAFLAEQVEQLGGRQPDVWPDPNANRLMTSDIDIAFDKAGFAEGFVFGVRLAFRRALDILWIESKAVPRGRWMRGVPPLLSFAEGDVFESPPTPRTTIEDERHHWRQTIRVTEAVADSIGEGGVRRDGWVRAVVVAYVDGSASGRDEISTTQAGFLEFLRTGDAPPWVERPAPTEAAEARAEEARDPGLIAIDYCDSKGNLNRRRIIVRAVEDAGLDLVVHATCLERHSARTFSGSRIRTVFDPETGEILGSPNEVLRRFIPQDA